MSFKEIKRVSIIIPSHNGGRLLKKVIKKARSQEYGNKEIIVVDDFSDIKDKELEKIKNIHLIRNDKNLGLAASLNKGIKFSTGEYIVTLLQDCIPYSKKWLKELVFLLEKKKAIAVCSRVKNDPLIWESQDDLVKSLTKNHPSFYSPRLDEKGRIYKKSYLEKAGFFDEKNFKFAGEDWDLYYKLSKLGKVVGGVKPYVIHKHFFNLEKLFWTKSIYGFSFGRLFRIYHFKLEDWFMGSFLRTLFPFWGIVKGIKDGFGRKRKSKIIKFSIKLNYLYTINFIKGFFSKIR